MIVYFKGYVGQHDSQPQKSSQKANFQALQDLGATESKKVLVTVHGKVQV